MINQSINNNNHGPNCKKRLFECAESTDINLGTAPLETGTQSFAILTSMLPLNAEVVPQAVTLDINENIIISSTEAPQQAEEVITTESSDGE